MLYENDRGALVNETQRRSKQSSDIVRTQANGWLGEDNDRGLGPRTFGDMEKLPSLQRRFKSIFSPVYFGL